MDDYIIYLDDYIIYLQDNKELTVRATEWRLDDGRTLVFIKHRRVVAVFNLDNIFGFKAKEGA